MSDAPQTADAPMAGLVRALRAELCADVRGRKVAGLLADYCATSSDWRRFAHFAAEGYSRNLVARDERFELLILCWNPGQESPIHNHAGQHCWMGVLEGGIEEVHFGLEDGRALRPATRASPGEVVGPLLPGETRRFEPGRVAYIHDEIALHLVRPADGRRGVSLHLYSRPIDVCNTYCPETGRVEPRELVYDTIEGRPAPL